MCWVRERESRQSKNCPASETQELGKEIEEKKRTERERGWKGMEQRPADRVNVMRQ